MKNLDTPTNHSGKQKNISRITSISNKVSKLQEIIIFVFRDITDRFQRFTYKIKIITLQHKKVIYICIGILGILLLSFLSAKWLLEPTKAPSTVRISNKTEAGFTISWITNEKPTKGSIYVHKESEIFIPLLSDIFGHYYKDERDILVQEWTDKNTKDRYTTHYINVGNLDPDTKYSIKIRVGNKIYEHDINGQDISWVHTYPRLQTTRTANPSYGKVITKDSSPAAGAIIYTFLKNTNENESNLLSGMTNNEGRFWYDPSTARVIDGSSYFSTANNNEEIVMVEFADEGRGLQIAQKGSNQPMYMTRVYQSSDEKVSYQTSLVEKTEISELAILNKVVNYWNSNIKVKAGEKFFKPASSNQIPLTYDIIQSIDLIILIAGMLLCTVSILALNLKKSKNFNIKLLKIFIIAVLVTKMSGIIELPLLSFSILRESKVYAKVIEDAGGAGSNEEDKDSETPTPSPPTPPNPVTEPEPDPPAYNPPQSCLLAGTQVITDNGQKPVSDLDKGEKVLGTNGYNTILVNRMFIRAGYYYLEIEIANQDNIYLLITEQHHIYLKDGQLKQVQNLQIGDKVRLYDQGKYDGKLISKEFVSDVVEVYSLEVNNDHSYYADNILVHNKVIEDSGSEVPAPPKEEPKHDENSDIDKRRHHNYPSPPSQEASDELSSNESSVDCTKYVDSTVRNACMMMQDDPDIQIDEDKQFEDHFSETPCAYCDSWNKMCQKYCDRNATAKEEKEYAELDPEVMADACNEYRHTDPDRYDRCIKLVENTTGTNIQEATVDHVEIEEGNYKTSEIVEELEEDNDGDGVQALNDCNDNDPTVAASIQCNTLNNTALCGLDTDCPGNQRCNLQSGDCVTGAERLTNESCRTNANCADGLTCTSGKCIDTSTAICESGLLGNDTQHYEDCLKNAKNNFEKTECDNQTMIQQNITDLVSSVSCAWAPNPTDCDGDGVDNVSELLLGSDPFTPEISQDKYDKDCSMFSPFSSYALPAMYKPPECSMPVATNSSAELNEIIASIEEEIGQFDVNTCIYGNSEGSVNAYACDEFWRRLDRANITPAETFLQKAVFNALPFRSVVSILLKDTNLGTPEGQQYMNALDRLQDQTGLEQSMEPLDTLSVLARMNPREIDNLLKQMELRGYDNTADPEHIQEICEQLGRTFDSMGYTIPENDDPYTYMLEIAKTFMELYDPRTSQDTRKFLTNYFDYSRCLKGDLSYCPSGIILEDLRMGILTNQAENAFRISTGLDVAFSVTSELPVVMTNIDKLVNNEVKDIVLSNLRKTIGISASGDFAQVYLEKKLQAAVLDSIIDSTTRNITKDITGQAIKQKVLQTLIKTLIADGFSSSTARQVANSIDIDKLLSGVVKSAYFRQIVEQTVEETNNTSIQNTEGLNFTYDCPNCNADLSTNSFRSGIKVNVNAQNNASITDINIGNGTAEILSNGIVTITNNETSYTIVLTKNPDKTYMRYKIADGEFSYQKISRNNIPLTEINKRQGNQISISKHAIVAVSDPNNADKLIKFYDAVINSIREHGDTNTNDILFTLFAAIDPQLKKDYEKLTEIILDTQTDYMLDAGIDKARILKYRIDMSTKPLYYSKSDNTIVEILNSKTDINFINSDYIDFTSHNIANMISDVARKGNTDMDIQKRSQIAAIAVDTLLDISSKKMEGIPLDAMISKYDSSIFSKGKYIISRLDKSCGEICVKKFTSYWFLGDTDQAGKIIEQYLQKDDGLEYIWNIFKSELESFSKSPKNKSIVAVTPDSKTYNNDISPIVQPVSAIKSSLYEPALKNTFEKEQSYILFNTKDKMIISLGNSGKLDFTGSNGVYKINIQPYGITHTVYLNKAQNTVLTLALDDKDLFKGEIVQERKIESHNSDNFTLEIFVDENKNKVQDYEEERYSIANTLVSIERVSSSVEYNLTTGWQLISIPLEIDNFKASDLLDEIVNHGGYATTVAKYQDGRWNIYKIRGGDTFSDEDFEIKPGEGYMVRIINPVLLTLAGFSPKVSSEFDLSIGWNLVGFNPGVSENGENVWQNEDPNNDDTWTADEILKVMQINGIEATTITEWDHGKYNNYILEKNLSFGFDYDLSPLKGYFILIKKKDKKSKWKL